MSQSQKLISNTRASLRVVTAAVSSLLLAVTTLGSSFVVTTEPVNTSRRIQVTCDCCENQPAGTLITRLGDHNLTLRNFRAAESKSPLPFTVDADSGAVCTTHDGQLDFESQGEFQFRVLADEESEYDEFLAEFSAGLVDSGLPEDELKSLSVTTVIFDIKVRLCDVQESPVLEDCHFLVELLDRTPVKFGCVNTNHHTPSADWLYYIASGNEDGIFQINPESGILSLDASASCKTDIRADFELEVLAENSAGEFATSHVFVNVHREIPELASEATSSMPSTTSLPEEISESHSSETPAVLANNEITELTAVTDDSQEESVNADGAEPEAASNINTLPNVNAINVDEVKQWIGGSEDLSNIPNANVPSVDSDAISRSRIAEPVASSSALISFQDSPGYLLTIGAFFIFLVACIAAVLVRFHASASRARKLEGDATEERLKSALNGIQQEEEIRLLKSELADRDQKIAQLKKELHSITHDFKSDDVGDADFQVERDEYSWASRGTKSSSDSRLSKVGSDGTSLPQGNSALDARASLGVAFEQVGRELLLDTQSLPFQVSSHDVSGEFLCESSETAVATLEGPQNLRSELADLFEIHGLEQTETSKQSSDLTLEIAPVTVDIDLPNRDPLETRIEPSQPEVLEKQEQASEDLHLDAIKVYLSKLFERSQNATNPEAILVDRRKTAELHYGNDRRATPEPSRPPVKSYLDAYMSAHGGELVDTASALSSGSTPEVVSDLPKPRPPVDVHSIREAMNSFRVVSIQSSEQALLSHLLRQAKAKIARRTFMIAGLTGITVLMFLANMKHVIDFSLLNWLMSVLVVLSVAELCLRVPAVMKQRRSVTSSIVPPRSVTQVQRQLSGDDSASG